MRERNLAFDYSFEKPSEEKETSKEVLDMLDHISEILTEEYVETIKQKKEDT